MRNHDNPNEEAIETLKRSLFLVLPGGIVLLLGSLAMLGVGLVFMTEGAPIIRSAVSDLPQPLRSLSYFAFLATPMVILCWCGKKGLGYVLSQINSSHRD